MVRIAAALCLAALACAGAPEGTPPPPGWPGAESPAVGLVEPTTTRVGVRIFAPDGLEVPCPDAPGMAMAWNTYRSAGVSPVETCLPDVETGGITGSAYFSYASGTAYVSEVEFLADDGSPIGGKHTLYNHGAIGTVWHSVTIQLLPAWYVRPI